MSVSGICIFQRSPEEERAYAKKMTRRTKAKLRLRRMSKRFHKCESKDGVTACYEDLNRRLFVQQYPSDAYETPAPERVNLCPFCGFRAKVKRTLKVKSRSARSTPRRKKSKQALKRKRK